jgi:NADH:ubiquinone oxidoreductase subunit E
MTTIDRAEDAQIASAVGEAIQAHGTARAELIPVLSDINEKIGYIPTKAFVEVSKAMRLPIGEVYSVASFYKMLRIEPRGEHLVLFCESAPCHVVGGRELFDKLVAELGINPGETSADGKWSLVMTSCIGMCSVGPVIVIDDEVHGNFSLDELPEILARYA